MLPSGAEEERPRSVEQGRTFLTAREGRTRNVVAAGRRRRGYANEKPLTLAARAVGHLLWRKGSRGQRGTERVDADPDEHKRSSVLDPQHPEMASKCPKCDKTVYFAEKVSSLGKDWHKLCLKCDRCNKLLNAGGHAEHDGRPYCHKPCYAALFGPKGVNIGGAGSYVYDAPANNNNQSPTCVDSAAKAEEKRAYAAKQPSKAGGVTTFSGEANMCPRCNKKVYFAEKVTSLGKDWHRPCLRCERCSKTLSAGGHAEHDGRPYCHKPCYAVLFGPKGVNTGGVGSYIYDKEPSAVTQP